MFKAFLRILVLSQTVAMAAHAHEFWVEPDRMMIPEGGVMVPVLTIGEQLSGETYRFQPQAYAQAIWSGPADQVDFSRWPLSGPKPAFRAFAPGLHSVAVATFPQKLTYATADDFHAFLAEVGREDLWPWETDSPAAPIQIRETYRRYAKTIVHFTARTGMDRRVGLRREWVWDTDAFVLFDREAPKANQKTKVTCRTGPAPQAVTEIHMVTGQDGTIRPALPSGGRCLINTVFMEKDAGQDMWKSDWVSLFLLVP